MAILFYCLNVVGAKPPTTTLAAMALKLASVETDFGYCNALGVIKT